MSSSDPHSVRMRTSVALLQLQQSFLERQATAISNKLPTASDFPMARDDYAYGVHPLALPTARTALGLPMSSAIRPYVDVAP